MTRPEPTPAELDVRLREVVADDVPIFFEHQLDPVANRMVAFSAADPTDRAAFDARWERILGDASVVKRAVLADGEVVGHAVAFERQGRRMVGYWIARSHWGRGIATRALAALLEELDERPLYAGAAKDNAGSLRVLEKCGFVIVGEDRAHAHGRGEEVEEYLLELR